MARSRYGFGTTGDIVYKRPKSWPPQRMEIECPSVVGRFVALVEFTKKGRFIGFRRGKKRSNRMNAVTTNPHW
jgi:hypothetical protein